jgi:hypothetical protein
MNSSAGDEEDRETTWGAGKKMYLKTVIGNQTEYNAE